MTVGRAATAAVLLLAVTTWAAVDWSTISTPPKFVHEANPETLYFTLEKTVTDQESQAKIADFPMEHTINCIAQANPSATYTWTKDGKSFLPHMYSEKVVQKPGEGTLVFSQLEESDAGEYQCKASNGNGTAVSRPTRLSQTWIRHFPDVEPEVVFVELGDPYQRNCTSPNSNPGARVYWILMGPGPGQFESINSSHISSNDQGTIFFHYANKTDLKDGKLYTCTAENTELKDYKFGRKFKLEITNNKRRALSGVPPTEQYVNQSSPVALQGNQHKLHCFFSGYPTPQPTWYHNGRLITDDDDTFRMESYGKTLVFNVTQDKAGKYDCRFTTQNDIDRTFVVNVEAAPYWPDGPPPNTNTSEGETVIFDCTTSGKPTPVVTFYKNGVELKGNGGDKGNWRIAGNKLTIFNVQKGVGDKADNAVYQCKAQNKHGYEWTNFYLNLLAFKPEFLHNSGQVEAVIGQTVTMNCSFFASPNAKIKWKSPLLAGVPHTVEPANAHGVGKLIIENVTPESEGEYECHAENKYGTSMGTTKLLVRKATRLEPFATTEEEKVAGEAIELPCEAASDEKLAVKYQWFVDGNPLPEMHIKSKHFILAPNNSLIITSPTQYDSAKYRCTATTKLDVAFKEIKIQIMDVPVPILSAYVSRCEKKDDVKGGSGQTAEISFQHMEPAETKSPVKEFWIQSQMDSDTDAVWVTNALPVHAAPLDYIEDNQRIVKGKLTMSLQPFGRYQFRVIARNAIGDSSPVLVKDICITPPMKPSVNPTVLSAKGAGPENLIVKWRQMPRSEWNGPNYHYKIKYRAKSAPGEPTTSQAWQEVEVKDPFADTVTITLDEEAKAEPYKPYEVQVYSVNDIGFADVIPETIEGRTGEGVPSSIPQGFRVISKDGYTATFAWNPVEESTANGQFTGYKITYWYDENEDEEAEDDYEDSDEAKRMLRLRRSTSKRSKRSPGLKRRTQVFAPWLTTGTINDLKPDTVNYATIQVSNGAHDGTPSEVISFRTEEGVPTAVRGLKAYPMNPMKANEKAVVSLIWKKPRQTNGLLLRYIIESCRLDEQRKVANSNHCSRSEVSNTTTEYRVTGLEYETHYLFVLRGYTKSGEGEPTSTPATSLPDVFAEGVDPGVPSFREAEIGDNFFNITFVPAEFDDEKRGPVGNTFVVEYKEADSEEWRELKPKDNSLVAHVDDLSPGTKYDVRVAAVQQLPNGEEALKTYSPIDSITTSGRSAKTARMWLILIILLIILLILIIICLICVALRHRGQNYPVSQKEKEQGREPILAKQHFGEYKTDDDEKRSLTGSKAESETDSMAEYGDTDPGRFTEDGSFIGQYVPQKTLLPAERPEKGSTSTFV